MRLRSPKVKSGGLAPAAFSILAVFLASAWGGSANARVLTLVTPPDTIDTVISEVILIKAYRALGYEVKIVNRPSERALVEANDGRFDGEVQRIDGIGKTYTNLVQVPVATNYIEGVAVAMRPSAKIDSLESLRGRRIGIVRGIKFAERRTVGMSPVKASGYEALLRMLVKGRVDIAISPRMNIIHQSALSGIDGIHILEPPLERFELFHYLHKKNTGLVPAISAKLQEMAEDRSLERIRARVILILNARASVGLGPCKDHGCYDD